MNLCCNLTADITQGPVYIAALSNRRLDPGTPVTGGWEVGSRVGSDRVRHCIGRVRELALEVGSGPHPGGSGRARNIGPGNNSGLMQISSLGYTLTIIKCFSLYSCDLLVDISASQVLLAVDQKKCSKNLSGTYRCPTSFSTVERYLFTGGVPVGVHRRHILSSRDKF